MRRLLCLLVLMPLWLSAQLFDNFNDGDFTNNPTWSGTTSRYTVNTSFQLQLNATEAGNAWLSTPYNHPGGNVEWRFWIRLNFAPSSSNFSDVFLVSNQPDPTGPLNGYFLRFGETGSNDAIELYRKQGTQTTRILRGTEAFVAAAFAINVRVTRSASGEWKLYADQTGQGLYQLQATGTDNTFQPGGFFAIYSQYTISNATRMYYDDIFFGSEIVDTTPPEVSAAAAISPFSIRVQFNEAIKPASLTNPQNYLIDQGVGNPAEVSAPSPAQAMLQLATPLDNGRVYNLTISNIEDLAGNIMAPVSVPVNYYEAVTGDVVINEIMADPSPVVGLPDVEFVELHNTTTVPINLENWKFFIGTSERVIGAVTIAPGGYLLLGHQNSANQLAQYGSFFGFSSFQLANAGASLSLRSNQGTLVSSVSYADTWYGDNKKKDGGWTLEQIDPGNPCGGSSNWTASNDASGGTPGRRNSVFNALDARPKPAAFRLIGDNILQLWFDQVMDNASMAVASNYMLKPGNIAPTEALANPADPSFVELAFSNPLQTNVLYTLEVLPAVLNCAGKPVLPGTVLRFAKPSPAEAGDVVINEVLFNPLAGGVDFVELYNKSEKIINLEDLRLGAVRQTIPNPPDTTLREIIATTRILLPGQIALLSTSTRSLTSLYPVQDTGQFIEMAQFPTYPNESGTVLLASRLGRVIDVFSYTEKMHHPLLKIVKGVSLERISPLRPSSDPNNWHSASQTVGFATPGYPNSMLVPDAPLPLEIAIEPELFSPDGDGKDELTTIRWNFPAEGNVLNIRILNAEGLQVRHLVKSMLTGLTGAVSWDGLDEQGRRLPQGIYVVLVESFAMDGTKKATKKPVVLVIQ
ncbi:MAG: lamin tail domain-containing protein [Bacteroidia bacterium]|nr:lamin tail domain-containing protein [Bacteroidia bacterium]